MYIPSAFAETRLEVLHDFIRAHDFATITTAGAGGLMASHVPVVLKPDAGPSGSLHFHLAKQNAQCQDLAAGGEALAVFQGPHGYISPRWYATEVAVPTWNYIVVHAYGKSRMLSPDELRTHLDELVAGYESRAADGWDTTRLPAAVGQKLREQIIGFEVAIKRLEGKWKLGQNRTRDDVTGAIDGLRREATPASLTLAERMREQLQSRE